MQFDARSGTETVRQGQDLTLRAGPLSLLFQPETAVVRDIRFGRHEVLRGIYAAVRDEGWRTIIPRVRIELTEQSSDAFRIEFDARARAGEVDFSWRGTLIGEVDGTVRFTMAGLAHSTFLRNRIGFCVLHPSEVCAGRPCTLEHADGTRECGHFPAAISPHQPFSSLRAIEHEIAAGVRAEVRMEGDVFEMEDQRNWTDASFKTYCTPLALPLPVEVKSGTEIRQAVTLSLKGNSERRGNWEHSEISPASVRAAGVEIVPAAGSPTAVPRIGLGLHASAGATSGQEDRGEAIVPQASDRLAALAPAHIRVDLRLDDANVESRLARAWRVASAVDAGLEAAIFVSDDAEQELLRLHSALQAVAPVVARWLIFHQKEDVTSERWIEAARRVLSEYQADVAFGGGTNAYFTEINRARPDIGVGDLACYSVNPQVHAFDNLSLMETLPVQAETVLNARSFLPDVPIAVSPVTLRPRTEGCDPRQTKLFGAAWTLGSMKYLFEGGATSITYYETAGPCGVMHAEGIGVFPLYHVLADVAPFRGGMVLPVVSSHTRSAVALLMKLGRRKRLLVANLTPDPQEVRVDDARAGAAASVRVLDESNVAAAMREPERFRSDATRTLPDGRTDLSIQLSAYAYACIDFASGVS